LYDGGGGLLNIVSVSGACSRSGKTALAVSVLRALGPGAAAAVKFTTTEDVFERCPRGTPCIVCDIDVPFRIVDDPAVLGEAGTDTERLGAAGAVRVVWTIAKAAAVGAAWTAVRLRLASHPLLVMEGSTIVQTARPDVLAFVVHPFLSPERWKPGAQALLAAADVVAVNRPHAETRPPSDAVLDALARARPRGRVIVGDVTRPLAEWAPWLYERLRELAPRAAAAGARA
jgi:hypothetical protein